VGAPATVLPAEELAEGVELDMGRTTESAMAAANSTAATAHVTFFDSSRRVLAQLACSASVPEDVPLGSGWAATVSRGLAVS
jgi:hypothetical protein